MKLLGFNFTNVSAEKKSAPKPGYVINTNIEFTNVEKEKIDLIKDIDTASISFKFSINYLESEEKKESKFADVSFEGSLLLSLEKEEAKELLKSWKKREVSPDLKFPLFNVIIKKVSPLAILLEDNLALPSHIPFPQIKQNKK